MNKARAELVAALTYEWKCTADIGMKSGYTRTGALNLLKYLEGLGIVEKRIIAQKRDMFNAIGSCWGMSSAWRLKRPFTDDEYGDFVCEAKREDGKRPRDLLEHVSRAWRTTRVIALDAKDTIDSTRRSLEMLRRSGSVEAINAKNKDPQTGLSRKSKMWRLKEHV